MFTLTDSVGPAEGREHLGVLLALVDEILPAERDPLPSEIELEFGVSVGNDLAVGEDIGTLLLVANGVGPNGLRICYNFL